MTRVRSPFLAARVRLSVTLLLGLASIASTLGCEARVSLGGLCSDGLDCPSPLTCLAGRCRDACDTLGDCPAPYACVLDALGRGACSVAEDARCGEGCTEPLVCLDGACVQPCDTPRDCAAGLACVAGHCDRAPSAPCDLLTGEGCETGRRCEVLADRTIGCAAVTVRRDEMLGLHELCGPTDTCEAGLACVDGRCIRYCLYDPDRDAAVTSCGAGSRCNIYDEVGAPAPSPSIGYCGEPCDPVHQSGCVIGAHVCRLSFEADLYYASCRNGRASCEGAEGDPGCTLGVPEGGTCAGADVSLHLLRGRGAAGPIEALCLRLCDAETPCPAGNDCFDTPQIDLATADGGARRLGACLPVCAGGVCGDTASALGLACEPSGRFCTAACDVDEDCGPAMRCGAGRCTPI